jgi:hypothetical protein
MQGTKQIDKCVETVHELGRAEASEAAELGARGPTLQYAQQSSVCSRSHGLIAAL